MKASELKKQLQQLIEKHGDLKVLMATSPRGKKKMVGYVYSDIIYFGPPGAEMKEHYFTVEAK